MEGLSRFGLELVGRKEWFWFENILKWDLSTVAGWAVELFFCSEDRFSYRGGKGKAPVGVAVWTGGVDTPCVGGGIGRWTVENTV